MSFVDAVRTCFSRYFQFSGRASRSEFWKFTVFLIIMHIALVFLNSAFFDPTVSRVYTTKVTGEGEELVSVGRRVSYNGGWFSGIFLALTFVPGLAVTWRRLHDISAPGWWSLSPWAISFFGGIALVLFGAGVSREATGPNGPVRFATEAGSVPFTILILTMFASMIILIFLLARRSSPSENKYGPVPQGVIQP